MKEAILSCSGGLDSTSLLLNLLKNDFNVHIANFNYGSKQNIFELCLLYKNIEYLKSKGFNVDYKTLDISDAMSNLSSSLTRKDVETPEGAYNSENQKVIFVPNRNAIFASIIYAQALSLYNDTGNDVSICMGIHANEVSVYPDCTPEFFDTLFNAFQKGNYNPEHIFAYNPYVNVTKQKVLEDAIDSCEKLGLDLNVIMKNTLSCYSPKNGKACGKCPTCVERLEIFKNLGLKDPAEYVI